ncbi:MAG: trehalose-6-phosphate synthase, partial [Caulobacteraceae bacterium]
MSRLRIIWRPSGLVGYSLLVIGLLAAMTMAVAPFSRGLIEQWSRLDVESRSRLVYNAIQGPIVRALTDGDSARLANILQGVAQDDRILAVGLCDERGVLHGATDMMPQTFSCQKVARSDAESFSSIVNDGRRVLVGSFPITTRDERAYLVVLHDLSFVDARAGSVQRYAVAALIGVALIIAAIAAFLVIFVLRGWTAALRRAVEDMRAGQSPLGPRRERTAVDAQIHRLLKDLEIGKAPTEDAEVQWSPKSLHDLLATALPGAEVIVLSNREPYIHNRTENGIVLQTPASGLVSALEPVIRACGGTWIAHGSGSADREMVDENDTVEVPPGAPAYRL